MKKGQFKWREMLLLATPLWTLFLVLFLNKEIRHFRAQRATAAKAARIEEKIGYLYHSHREFVQDKVRAPKNLSPQDSAGYADARDAELEDIDKQLLLLLPTIKILVAEGKIPNALLQHLLAGGHHAKPCHNCIDFGPYVGINVTFQKDGVHISITQPSNSGPALDAAAQEVFRRYPFCQKCCVEFGVHLGSMNLEGEQWYRRTPNGFQRIIDKNHIYGLPKP